MINQIKHESEVAGAQSCVLLLGSAVRFSPCSCSSLMGLLGSVGFFFF